MSLKTLTTASLGWLKQGLKKTLTTASLGWLQFDEIEPEKPKRKNGGDLFVQPGIANFNKYNVQSNNNAIILAETGVF